MRSIEVIGRGVCVKDHHLLVYQNMRYGYFCLPGGHVEWEERIEAAIRREWQEEVGCDCRVGEFLKHFESFFEREGKRHHHCVFLHRVTCDAVDVHQPLRRMEPHIALQWLPIEQISTCSFISKEQQDFLCEYVKSLTC